VGCGPPHFIEESVDEQGYLTTEKSAGTAQDFRIRNSDLHIGMANGKDQQKRMDIFSGRTIQPIGQNRPHRAKEIPARRERGVSVCCDLVLRGGEFPAPKRAA
jgi:hypothetical protein